MLDPDALPTPEILTMYGADWCRDCRRAKAFLEAAGVPFAWVDLEADRVAETMLHDAGYLAIPVVVFPDRVILVEPSDDALAQALGVPG